MFFGICAKRFRFFRKPIIARMEAVEAGTKVFCGFTESFDA